MVDPTYMEYIWAGLSSVVLGWIAYDIRNNRKEQSDFQTKEREERIKLERKIDKEYLKEDKHTLLCGINGLTLAKNITKHFDEKLKEHGDELKTVIKDNGNKT